MSDLIGFFAQPAGFVIKGLDNEGSTSRIQNHLFRFGVISCHHKGQNGSMATNLYGFLQITVPTTKGLEL